MAFTLQKTCLSNESLGNKIPRSENVTFQPLAYPMFTYSNEHLGAVKACPFINSIPEHNFVLSRKRCWATDLPAPALKYVGMITLSENKVKDIETENIAIYN